MLSYLSIIHIIPAVIFTKIGALAVAVPGEVAGYREAHQRYGRLPWSRLVLPSVLLATKGLPVNSDLARILRNEAHNIASEPSLS